MPSYPVSAYLSIAVLGILVGVQYNWQELVNSVVPEPYLDEVFHVPQAQAYWQGRWKQWDPKITTPPGLYLFSWIIGKSRELVTGHFDASTAWLRSNNFIILQLLTITLVLWSVATKRQASNETVLRRELVITMFPLLFFFSGLYYTDLLSTLSVMLSYMFWAVGARSRGQTQSRLQSLHFVMGGFSMLTRQTNVFWVAIFLGGLQIIETIKKAKPKQVHDSPMSEAFFEGRQILTSTGVHWLICSQIFQLPQFHCWSKSEAKTSSCSSSSTFGHRWPFSPSSQVSFSATTAWSWATDRTMLRRSIYHRCSMSGPPLSSSPGQHSYRSSSSFSQIK